MLGDWQSAGLRAASCFRAYVLTAHRSELAVIGHLSGRDWESVKARVSTVTGPIVALNFSSDHPGGISPHQRWATGLLADGAQLSGTTAGRPGIAFLNATNAGSGHGWVVGWAVAWNVTSPYVTVQQPPGTMNWCIGCVGQQVNTPLGMLSGVFDSPGVPVLPASLYLAQLRERLGDQALANIGYGVNDNSALR